MLGACHERILARFLDEHRVLTRRHFLQRGVAGFAIGAFVLKQAFAESNPDAVAERIAPVRIVPDAR